MNLGFPLCPMQEVCKEGKPLQNHKDQINATVLFHFSLTGEQSDNLLLKDNTIIFKKEQESSCKTQSRPSDRQTHAHAHILSGMQASIQTKDTDLAKASP